MEAKELKQIATVAERTLRLYINGSIEEDQINEIFHTFTHSGPNCWPSRIIKKIMNDEDWRGSFEDNLGKDYERILDLFVSSPGYYIGTYGFSIEKAFGIILSLSHIVDEYERFTRKKAGVFEGML